MEPSEKLIKETQTALEKEHGRPISYDEAEKAVRFLQLLAEMVVDNALEDARRQSLLRASPAGFHFDKKGYSCRICRSGASGENSWFDEYGLKCGCCQQAINDKGVPPTVVNHDTWYSDWELEHFFGLTATALRHWRRKGWIVSRTIARGPKQCHLTLYLIGDNPE